jgi:hypothetical protein
MCEDQAFRDAMYIARISWVPFIIDKSDENRNVSLKEYWGNPDQYRFCHRIISLRDGYHSDIWYDFDPNLYYDTASGIGVVILGGLK